MDRAVLRLRYEHHETRRREKLQIALQERETILDEERRGEWVPPGKVGLGGVVARKDRPDR